MRRRKKKNLKRRSDILTHYYYHLYYYSIYYGPPISLHKNKTRQPNEKLIKMLKNLMIKPQRKIYKSSFKTYTDREKIVDAFSTRLAVNKKNEARDKSKYRRNNPYRKRMGNKKEWCNNDH